MGKRRNLSWLVAAWCLIVCFSPGRAAGAGLTFGLISSGSAQHILESWRPFLDDLQAALGIPVESKIYDDYAGVIWAMAAGHVQIAWFGNKSAIEAVDRADGEVAFRTVDANGLTEYHSLLLVRADSGLGSLDDVLARAGELTFGDGDANSTSGHLIPGYYIFGARHLDPRRIFRRVVQHNHEGNFLAVAEGRADVATNNTIDMARCRERYPDKIHSVKIVWRSPPIPSDPIVWRTDLAPDLKSRVRTFFLGYGKPGPGKTAQTVQREKTILAGMTRAGFMASDNSQLNQTRLIGLHLKYSSVESDTALGPRERQERLAAITASMRAIDARQQGGAP